jgi:diguanylate cyclase (GGDEF)-like protein/PAS domain S-box-containing protein
MCPSSHSDRAWLDFGAISSRLALVLRVLVVGPESLSGELGPTILGRPDIDRVHQPDPESAVEMAEKVRPHMVILDLPLPEAVDLVQRLREKPSTRHSAIVWLNRSDPPEIEGDLTAAGANAVVPLPIDPFLWDRRLEELLSVPARRTRRIQAHVRDWSSFISGEDEFEGAVLNIGGRGVLLETSRPLELGAKVGLRLRLPGDDDDVAAVGQVVRTADGEGPPFRVGVEFLIYRGEARERINAFVEAEPEPERPGAPAEALPLTVRPFEEAREWEEELRASELRKALILDSARDCIVTVDHEGRILEFNSAARRAFGYSRSEILGRAVTDTIVPPSLRDELRKRLRAFVRTGDNPDLGRQRETIAMRADGTTFPVEVVVVPAYVKGRVLLTAYIRDLTDRSRARRLDEVRHRVTQVLTEALSVAEAAPPLLAALAGGLDCEEVRLWLAEGAPVQLILAGSATGAGGSPRSETPEETVAQQVAERGEPVWAEGLDAPTAGSVLAVPVRGGGQLLGVLEARCAASRVGEEQWSAALADIGSQIGLFLKRLRAEADLQMLARYDSLTGLPNRSFFLDSLERTLSRASRRQSRAALVFLDLDGFKTVNDRLGHAAGDTVLQTVADRLRAGTRTSDLVARIGGDEFTVLVQDLARADDAALVARGLLDRLVQPLAFADEQISLSASAGISVFPDDGADARALLRHADLAMYRAKSEGKNDYRFFIAEMSERARERMALLDGLRSALERDEFGVVYQPIVYRQGPPWLEALLRWRHPEQGVVAPAGFIAQAEESGLILPIGARVLRAATRFAASLPGECRLVVNLSARQFLQPDLVTEVEKALRASGLPASRLEIDLSEQTVMTGSREVKERLQRLRGLGIELALDDFGTGFFSIAHIRELGFRVVKIDRSLVAGLPDHAEHAALVEAILVLARSLGLDVVAEGVETEAERAFLEDRGCAGLQGFLLSPPLELDEARAFIESRTKS